ncbi:MAG: class I SAM-dependent methyltransferase [Alphaproteobacteria bacterium]|nr:class I SAM-dependent methyltransferase [Alphaproteobacteria bacterium]
MTEPAGNTVSGGDERVPFGQRDVAPEEKPALVQGVFDSVALRYDLMNDLMSGGVHRLWKRAMLDTLKPRPGWTLVDLAGGTGDIAFAFLERVASRGRVIVCDLTPAMLQVGRDRALDRALLGGADWGVAWVAGAAERIPLANRSADAVTIAFGLRNVTDMPAALSEIRRVLRPGGRFLCLEFSRCVVPGLDRLYDLYSFAVLPRLGQVVTGDADAYRYLVESIRRFPPQEELARHLTAAGFARVNWRNLSGGIAALHWGWRV